MGWKQYSRCFTLIGLVDPDVGPVSMVIESRIL